MSSVDPCPPRLVLDTNVVLDCFVFGDVKMRELTAAIEARVVRLLVHDYTLNELRRVLGYAQCGLTQAGQTRIFERYVAVSVLEAMPANFSEQSLLLPAGFPQCRDPHDQPFLALAYHARADFLITKDRALLKLKKKARKFDVKIVPTWPNSIA